MRLIYPQPPAGIRDLAYRALNMETLRHPHPEGSNAPANAAGHVPDLHKVFLLDLAAVGARKGLRAARHMSWYDVVVLSGIAHGIEIARAGKADGTFVTRGEDVERQLAILTSLAARRGSPVEIRILRIPWIANFTLWLHRGKSDRLIPIITATSRLEAGREYSPAAFFAAIRDAASHIHQTHGTPKRPIKRKR